MAERGRDSLEICEIDGLTLAVRLVEGRPRDLLVRPTAAPDLIDAVVSARILRFDRSLGQLRLDIGAGREAVVAHSGPPPAASGARVLVQIVGLPNPADPDKAIEARLGFELRGRAVILRPGARRVRVSDRLPDAPAWIDDLPEGGWVVRYASAGLSRETVLAEASRLATTARAAIEAHAALSSEAPAETLVAAPDLLGLWFAEGLTPDRILVEGDARAVARAIARYAPDLADRVGRLAEPAIAARLPGLIAPERTGAGGARVTVETTRLGVAIDLDRGAAPDPARANAEGLALAAEAIRLGNLSGRILIDPAGALRGRAAEAAVAEFRGLFDDDPRRPRLPARLTATGLLELTRRRLGYSLAEAAARVSSHS